MSCTSSFFGTTATLSFGGFGSGGTEDSPPSAWNLDMRVLLYDQPSENFFCFFGFFWGAEGSIWQRRRRKNGSAYSHDDLRIGIAAIYCGHGLRWGRKKRSGSRGPYTHHSHVEVSTKIRAKIVKCATYFQTHEQLNIMVYLVQHRGTFFSNCGKFSLRYECLISTLRKLPKNSSVLASLALSHMPENWRLLIEPLVEECMVQRGSKKGRFVCCGFH